MKQNSRTKSHKTTRPGAKPRRSANIKDIVADTPSSSAEASLPALRSEVGEALKTATEAVKEGGVDTGIIEETPTKQWWYRKPDSKTRKTAEKIAVMDAAGLPDAQIAKKLKTSEGTIRITRFLAKKNGWWDENDQPVDLEVELALTAERKAVRNLNAVLDGKMTNWQTHEATLETLKGRGHFKKHDKVEGQVSGPSIVAIQVVMPAIGAADQRVAIQDSQVGGTPAYAEGEVVDGESVGQQRQLSGESGQGAGEAAN